MAWLALLAAGVTLSACGLKTPPQPLSEVLPAPTGVHAWQRDGGVIVRWGPPTPKQREKYGGVRGYELWIQARPLLCPDCAPATPRRVRVVATDPALHGEAGALFYGWQLGPQVGELTVRVSTRFGIGQGPASKPVRVVRAGAIPTPVLHWRWEGGTAASGPRLVQFYWPAVQERIVQFIGTDAVPREHALNYRANLYRRVPPADWPTLPLNPTPVTASHLTVPPLQSGSSHGAKTEAYQLRFVDQFGNEGPPSAEVRVPLSGREP